MNCICSAVRETARLTKTCFLWIVLKVQSAIAVITTCVSRNTESACKSVIQLKK